MLNSSEIEKKLLEERILNIIFTNEFKSSVFLKNFRSGMSLSGNLKYFEDIKKNILKISAKESESKSKTDLRIAAALNNVKNCRLNFINIYDANYPALLKEIFYPPAFLFYKGERINNNKNMYMAIVGTRRCTRYGEDAARCFSTELSKIGFTIVSGMASGIDAAVHECALKEKGGTVGVLGTGIDIVYPSQNIKLFEKIKENGSIVTEFFPGTPPLKQNFPSRNRIISGMSMGVIIIEAREKSGAIITAESALRENREIFAVPGSIFSNSSSGCHNLIRQGAILADKIDDILDNLSHYSEELRKNKLFSETKSSVPEIKKNIRTKKENEIMVKKIISENFESSQADACLKICNCIDSRGVSLEYIMSETGLNIDVVLKILSFLEIKDIIIEKNCNSYAARY